MSPKLKRVLKITAMVVAAVVALVVAAAAYLFGPIFITGRPPVDGFEVEGIRMLRTAMVSLAVVPVGPNEVVLIDGGFDASGAAVLTDLSRRNLGPEAVKAILITHGHGDHMGAIQVFPKAEVMALDAEVSMIEGGAQGPPVNVTSPLHDGQTVTIGNTEIRVYAIPGHSPGHAAYVVNGVLFLGDAALVRRDGTLRNAHAFFSEDVDQNRASLIKLHDRLMREQVEIKAIACAHSAVLTNGITALTAFAQTAP
jgi:glyoxylase-like metal-dependent hydrolase (beta-lactamase superfamily II)